MAKIQLVRQELYELTAAERDLVRLVIFKIVDGLGEQNRRRWRGWWKRLLSLEPGEMVELTSYQERILWYHKKHFLLEQRLFDGQEQFTNFERFRDWLKVGAGFVEYLPNPMSTEGLMAFPKSVAWDQLPQLEFEEFHANCLEFIRTDRCSGRLWPHLSVGLRTQMAEDIIANAGADRM